MSKVRFTKKYIRGYLGYPNDVSLLKDFNREFSIDEPGLRFNAIKEALLCNWLIFTENDSPGFIDEFTRSLLTQYLGKYHALCRQ